MIHTMNSRGVGIVFGVTGVILSGCVLALQFFAIDAKTGEVLWLGPPRQATNTAVVKAGELLFLLNDDAELIVASRLFIKDVSSLALWTLN